jgi:segregation and condensation protein B
MMARCGDAAPLQLLGIEGHRERSVDTKSLVESLLFAADHPTTVEDLAMALQVNAEDVELALEMLQAEYEGRGLRLQQQNGRIQMVSAPEAGPYVERLLGLEGSGRLSMAALETLSIICYRQPITRAQIEAIRGVDSTSVLRSLVRRGVVEEVGRADTVGHPILFGTTFEFLQQFGLQSAHDLPDWEEISEQLEERAET